ncbi:MAG: AMP-binding protein [Polyangiaceae bacterium]|nr:AMP-binding protein [Polyangiaceae bacterium]
MTEEKNLLEWAYHWELTSPDTIFMTQPLGGGDSNVRHYTYRDALDEARKMASYLRSLGFPPKSQIAICSKNCAHWIIADLAIWMAGHVSVPVFPTLTPEILRYTLEHSESKLLFVGKLDPVWNEMKAGVPAGLPRVAFPLAPAGEGPAWDEVIAGQEPLQQPVDRDPDELATIIYTSGSTGNPKGVMQSFRSMLTCSHGISRVLNPTRNDRYLSYLPLAHGMERWLGECTPLVNGYRVFFAESLDTFLEDLQRARPTLFLSVPRLWTKFQNGVFAKMPPAKLDRLLKIPLVRHLVRKKILTKLGLEKVRFAGSGSAPISAELIEWYRGLGLELLEGYGMTEDFNYSHVTRPGKVRPGYVGSPYDDVICRIAEDGEVQLKTPGAMMGYFKMPHETKEAFTADGYLRTGDLGEVDADNRLKLTGRSKEIFKTSKGKYVAPSPIESHIMNHPHVEQCCVSGAGKPQPHAMVLLSDAAKKKVEVGGKDEVIRDLIDHLQHVNSQLPSYETLAFIKVIEDDWLPENGFLTPTMKIKRGVIEGRYSPMTDGWYDEKRPIVWQ